MHILFVENEQNVVAIPVRGTRWKWPAELEERVAATTIQTISEANSSTIADSR